VTAAREPADSYHVDLDNSTEPRTVGGTITVSPEANLQPDSQRALEEHLRDAAHPEGEYYYGCQGQRSTIRVTTGEDGEFVRTLANG
jgi:hypothetical protein